MSEPGEKTVVKLEKWYVNVEGHGYLAPELQVLRLHGDAYGHPRHTDGTPVSTSRIVDTEDEGRVVVTRSGTRYELGEIDPSYKKWLDDKGYDWDPDHPFKCLWKS